MSNISSMNGLNPNPDPKVYDVRVDVTPEYLSQQSSPADMQYVYAYHVRVENHGTMAAQVIARQWVIKDGDGHIDTVKGLGLVGRQPYLKPGEHFEYSSGCHLNTPTGSMRGKFMCIADDTTVFDALVLPFELYLPPNQT